MKTLLSSIWLLFFTTTCALGQINYSHRTIVDSQWERQGLPNTFPKAIPDTFIIRSLAATKDYVLAFTTNGIYRTHSDSLQWRLINTNKEFLFRFNNGYDSTKTINRFYGTASNSDELIYLLTSNGLGISKNEGKTFEWKTNASIQSLIRTQPFQFTRNSLGELYAVSRSYPRQLFISNNEGDSFEMVSTLPFTEIEDVVVKGDYILIFGYNIVVAGKTMINERVIYSKDRGKTWTYFTHDYVRFIDLADRILVVESDYHKEQTIFSTTPITNYSPIKAFSQKYYFGSDDKFIIGNKRQIIWALPDSVHISSNMGRTWRNINYQSLQGVWYGSSYSRILDGIVDSRNNLFLRTAMNLLVHWGSDYIYDYDIYRYKHRIAVANETNDTLPQRSPFVAYPNPSHGIVTLQYHTERASANELIVFDVLGKEVLRLSRGVEPSGTHEWTWQNAHLPSGMYLVQLKTDAQTQTLRMVKR